MKTIIFLSDLTKKITLKYINILQRPLAKIFLNEANTNIF